LSLIASLTCVFGLLVTFNVAADETPPAGPCSGKLSTSRWITSSSAIRHLTAIAGRCQSSREDSIGICSEFDSIAAIASRLHLDL
jgi:hypothetical protein